MRRTINAIRRVITIVRGLGEDIRYATLNGDLRGAIRTGDMLDRLGITLPDGQASWYGRHVAKAYRAANDGQDAPKAWVRHRTTGRWIRVHVYAPTNPALLAGLRSYKATAGLISQALFAECA
ncbi:hypothetical protein ACPC54_23865 [Kitasatospora sp. NPDC094028]